MSEANIAAHIEAVQDLGTFNLIDYIDERAYAEEDVRVILDDQIGYEWEKLSDEAKGIRDAIRLKDINKRLEQLREDAEKHTFVLRLKGISERRREELLDEAVAQYPREYDEYINPLSGQKIRDEKDSPLRDRLYIHLLWAEHLIQITAPDGRIQTEIGVEDAAVIRSRAPYSALLRIQKVVEDLRVATDWQDRVINEDF